MSVKITDNTPQATQNIRQKMSTGLRLVLDEIHRTSTPKTPKRLGDLRNRIHKQVLGLKGKIAWETGYAIYQETKQFKNYTTPGTGPKFAEKSVREVVKRSADIFKRVL